MKTKILITLCLLAALAGCLLAWRTNPTQHRTQDALKEAEVTVDKRLPAVVPERADEAKERTVKDRAAVHEEAKTLSRDHLCDALNSELALWKRYSGYSYWKW